MEIETEMRDYMNKRLLFIITMVFFYIFFIEVSCIETYAEEYPTSYSSKDKGYITSIKDQKNDTCWAFATIAAMEASLVKNNKVANTVDLSEAQLVYFTYNKPQNQYGDISKDSVKLDSELDYTKFGGSIDYVMNSVASGVGITTEDKLPYSKFNKNSKYSDSYAYNTPYYVKDVFYFNMSDRDAVKQAIMDYAAVVTSYYSEEEHYNDTNTSYYYDEIETKNHGATIVGWDDNYSKDNFKEKPEHDGAWLVKNSWGKRWGNEGYFWLSYYDKNMLEEKGACFSMAVNTNDYKDRYQYDGTYSPWKMGNVKYQANIFTSKANEVLTDVMIMPTEENLNYEIKVYKNVKTLPEDGTMVCSCKGELGMAGYQTITLPQKIGLLKDTRFSIVVEMTRDDGTLADVAMDKSMEYSWVTFTNYAEAGQSYMADSDKDWIDLGKAYTANCRIKALTKPIVRFDCNKVSPQRTNITIQLKAVINGFSNAKCKFLIRDSANRNVVNTSYLSTNIYNWKPTKSGTYKLYIYAQNLDSKAVHLVGKVFKISNIGIKGISTSRTMAPKGVRINMKGVATGGYGTKYYYYKVKNINNAVLAYRKYSTTSTFSWYPKIAGTYYLQCYIKDSSGIVVTKQIKYVVSKKYMKSLSVVGVVQKINSKTNKITFKANMVNGYGTKYYYFAIKNSAGKTIKGRNYSTANTYSCLLNKGSYKVICYAKDKGGTVLTKSYSYSF